MPDNGKTAPATQEYRDNFDRIFGKKTSKESPCDTGKCPCADNGEECAEADDKPRG